MTTDVLELEETPGSNVRQSGGNIGQGAPTRAYLLEKLNHPFGPGRSIPVTWCKPYFDLVCETEFTVDTRTSAPSERTPPVVTGYRTLDRPFFVGGQMVRSRYTETSYTDDRDTIVVTVDLNNVQLLVREHATGRAVEVAMDPVCVKELIESLQEAQTEVGA